jgi:hypothetical protein
VTKYYKAKVEMRQIIEVEVTAESEQDARTRAKEAALQRVPGADAWTIDLSLLGETEFNVGSRIKHALFGAGEILSLIRSTGPSKDLGFRVTVQFDSGDKKDLHLPHATVTPEHGFGA